MQNGNVAYIAKQIYLHLHFETLTTLHRSVPPRLYSSIQVVAPKLWAADPLGSHSAQNTSLNNSVNTFCYNLLHNNGTMQLLLFCNVSLLMSRLSLVIFREVINTQGFLIITSRRTIKLYSDIVQLGARCWWRSWLRHCATSRKVAGSIPDGVIIIFH